MTVVATSLKRSLLLILYSVWTYPSSAYVLHIQSSIKANCVEAGCRSFASLPFDPALSFLDRFTLLTFGLPGILRELIVVYYNIQPPHITNSPTNFVVLLLLGYVLYVIPALVVIKLLLSLLRLVLRTKYPHDKQNIMEIGIIGGAIIIGFINFIIIPQNRGAYSLAVYDPSSLLRDNIRKQHINRLKNGFESYRLLHDGLPAEIDERKQFISSQELDFCGELVLEIGAVPLDPTRIVKGDTRGYLYRCPDEYDTGFQIQKINESEYELSAPFAETEVIKTRM